MPTVPYNPVPDVRPEAPPAPQMRVDTPGAAFGTTIGSAISSVGGSLAKDGDEIFTRAMALQDLANRTSADQANTNFITALGNRHAQWQSLRGQQSVEGYPKYQQDAQDLRNQFGEGLNPMARKLYDTDSRSQLARTLFSAAGHMGEENVKWQLGTADSTLQSLRKQSYLNPEDESSFQDRLNKTHTAVQSIAPIAGWGAEEAAVKEYNAKSSMWSDRIKGLAETKPLLAMKMLEANKANLTSTDYDAANRVLTPHVISTVSRGGAQNIMQGWDPRMDQGAVERGNTIQEPLQRIVQRAQQNHPELNFTIPSLGGARTQEQQNQLVAAGTSKTYHSAHLEGRAVDLAPIGPNGQINFNDKVAYQKIEDAMYEASIQLGIPLSGEHDKIKGWDPGHYSIDPMPGYQPVQPQTDETLAQKRQRGRAWAGGLFPDNEVLSTGIRDALDARLNSQWHSNLADVRDENFRNATTVGEAILGMGGGPGTKKPTSIEELRSDPATAAAFDALPVATKNRMLNALATNAKDDYKVTEEGYRTLHGITGLAETNPDEFLQKYTPEAIINLPLPQQWRSQLLTLQKEKVKNATQNPAVTHALQVLGPQLQAFGVDRTDKARFSTFVGTLHDQVQKFTKDNSRPPKDDEIISIGSRLLQQQHTHFWQSSQGMFEIPVPAEEVEKIRNDPEWAKRNVVPTDDMIQRVWIKKKYQELYGTAPSVQQSK